VTPQCPIEATLYGEYFFKPPAAFFAAAFELLLLYQIWSVFKSRAWGFSIWLCLGTIFETVSYISRVEMADNPWKKDAFQKQLVLLIIGPTLIAAAIAITFKHFVLYYNPSLSILRPRWYPFVFV
jgi:ABC-type multidrug transport system fused ATPase/permease subunit